MRVNFIGGRDNHAYRVEQGLRMLGFNLKVGEPEKGERFEWAFISPSHNKEYEGIADSILLFDGEDSWDHFDPDVAYYQLKDKDVAYGKVSFKESHTRPDNLKNVGLPVTPFLSLKNIASVDLPIFRAKNAIPYMAVSPTFIGSYKGNAPADPRFLAEYAPGDMIYNQRYQWLHSLEDNNIPYAGGVVFTNSNVGLDWQSKYFGDQVKQFSVSRVNNNLEMMVNYRIGLNPTGMDRNSWRIFDAMAVGSILISTDRQGQRHLYSPRSIIEIKDDEDLGTTLLTLQPDYKELWKEHSENRKILSQLTPEIIWKDFKEQLI